MKHLEVPTRRLSAVLVILLVLGISPKVWAVANIYQGPDLGNWNVSANWAFVPPDAAFSERGEIGNNATVILNDHTKSESSPGAGLVNVDVAGLVLGTVAGQTGGLRITNGGVLPVVAATGEAGAIVVGSNATGTGTLTILGGGTASGVTLSSGGAAGSSITIGDTTALPASVTVTGAANLQRTTNIIGPNVTFSAGGNLTLGSTHTLTGEIRNATNHSALKSAGTAAINGVFKPTFVGVTPAAGNKWTIIDAMNITGGFSSIDSSMAPALPAGQAYQMIQENGGMNGKLLRLSVEEILTLNVNRTTGAVSIANIGAQAKTIDGYSILSTNGSLRPANGVWNSLDDQDFGGPGAWVEAAPTVNNLSELYPQAGGSTINGGGSLNLGTPYATAFPAFGQDPDDVRFEYTHTDGRIINGSVVYSGTKVINDLIITVNPANGQVQLKNDSPYDVFIDGYAVRSTAGSLVPGTWNSLQDQAVTGWQEAGNPNPTPNIVSELRSDGMTRLTPGSGFNLGALAKTSGTGLVQDLQFEFLQPGTEIPTEGQVIYGTPGALSATTPGVLGDFNNNGTVDAADYVVWRKANGTNTVLRNDPMGGTVGAGQYQLWRANFGRTAAAGAGASLAAVPEPATVGLVVLATLALAAAHRPRHMQR